MVDLGASVGYGIADTLDNTAFLTGAEERRYSTTQYLLEHAGANMEDGDKRGVSVWPGPPKRSYS
jgi:hypothetical protein